MTLTDFPYRWAWAKWPTDSWTEPGPYKGIPCRVLVRGRRNKALLEFEDGTLVVASRNGLRRRQPTSGGP